MSTGVAGLIGSGMAIAEASVAVVAVAERSAANIAAVPKVWMPVLSTAVGLRLKPPFKF